MDYRVLTLGDKNKSFIISTPQIVFTEFTKQGDNEYAVKFYFRDGLHATCSCSKAETDEIRALLTKQPESL